MNEDEANQIIAEFMGEDKEVYNRDTDIFYNRYGNSLDNLVPVWDKLNVAPRFDKMLCDVLPWVCNIENMVGNIDDDCVSEEFGKTIQQAAAHATAKAILEISNES